MRLKNNAHMIDIPVLMNAFQIKYGETPRLFRAPGRVNLIGEHTDYNDGFVLPMAIDRQTIAAIAPRSDRLLKVWSLNLDEELELNLDALGCGRRKSWSDYIEGTVAAVMTAGVPLMGANIAIKSDITLGGGLSSSAALEMSFAKALITISHSRLDNLSLALAGQTAEHVHVGINSGIMDQFTSVHGSAGNALLLDCRSFKAKSIPLNLQGCCIVVCNSNVRHSLASSEYNLRRQACENGVARLRSALPGIKALRDVSMDDFEKHKTILSDTVLRCCRHVISENARTLQAAEVLEKGNIEEMGSLMSASHQSLRDDYKVSCMELDVLVKCAQAQPGVLGARLTGGGFGGCTVNLVQETCIEAFKENVSRQYQFSTGLTPEIFVVTAGDGASEISSK
jgi:galactokinase